MWKKLILVLFLSTISSNICKADSENKVLELAVKDLITLPIETQLYTRYIWIDDPDVNLENLKSVSFTLNCISTASVTIRPYPIKQVDNVLLARIDLRTYAPQDKDLKRWVKTWEEYQFDPKFSFLITENTLKFAQVLNIKVEDFNRKKKTIEKIWPGGPDETGRVYPKGYKYTTEIEEEQVNVVRVISNHIDKKLISTLIEGTKSQAPIVNYKYFTKRALTTIQGKGVFKTIYRGLYYDFIGIETDKKRNKGTDEDVFLENLGIGNVENGITADKIFDKLRSDQRIALFKSKVTGKPRRVDFLKTLINRDGEGVVVVTHDIKDDDVDIDTHPIMNLLNFKDRAREVIFTKSNGFQGYVLFNDQGVRQDVVPPDVAGDHLVPVPYTPVLQPAISCIRCHGKERGWKVSNNDIKKLLTNKTDIFDDISDNKKSINDKIDRIVGLYSGDLEFKLLPRLREDYGSVVLKSTGPWKQSKDQVDIVQIVSNKIADVYKSYDYTEIDATKALIDLGITIPKDNKAEDNQKLLGKLLPPIVNSAKVTNEGAVFIPEDPRIFALVNGLSINRSDYDLIYSFIASRITREKK